MIETTLAETSTLSLSLPAEAVAKLRMEAELHGQTLEGYIQHLLLGRISPERNGKHPPAVEATALVESLEDTYDYRSVPFPAGPTIPVRWVLGEPWTPQPYPEER